MTADNRKILAGSLTAAGLASFAPADTPGPVSITTQPSAAFVDAGWIDPSGLVVKAADSSKDILGYGSTFPLRTIISETKRTFDVTFLETNHTTLEIYNRLPIGSTGVADGTGHVSLTVGAAQVVQYAAVFDVIDGQNHLRLYVPRLQVTSVTDLSIKAGEAITYGVSFTAYPDANGKLYYEDVIVGALAYS